jgi:hypothetical protein
MYIFMKSYVHLAQDITKAFNRSLLFHRSHLAWPYLRESEVGFNKTLPTRSTTINTLNH